MNNEMKLDLAQELAQIILQIKRAMWQPVTGEGLRYREFMLLTTIMDAIDPKIRGIKLSELSARLKVTPAAITQMVNTLAEGGYLERLSDSDDRRVVLVAPTELGRKFVRMKEQKFLENFRELVEYMGEHDSRELLRLMTRQLSFFQKNRNREAQSRT
ncbi:MAG: MarR family transcriptional regulator [Candidatus Wallbacteria bacterium]|nr:MarR family transcriptional regulator [Candidatus Wallbacteria bacterium]